MTSILERIVAIIAPHYCLMCSSPYNVICKSCLLQFIASYESGCFKCGAITKNSLTCPSCKQDSPLINVWAGAEYSGAVSSAIKKFKFNRCKSAALPLAAIINSQLPINNDFLITYIPTTPQRIRQRGYDQAFLLAKEVSKLSGQPLSKLLYRKKDCRQLGLSRRARDQQIDNAFAIINPQKVHAKNILIIDDVITTGATLNSAAKTLAAAGAQGVYAATVAKQIKKF